jgi:hypothetical protein
MENQVKGIVIASAVAALLLACGSAQQPGAPPTAAQLAGKVKCTGINECRAKGVCAQAEHSCSGMNECRGKGVALVSADECSTRGGTKL